MENINQIVSRFFLVSMVFSALLFLTQTCKAQHDWQMAITVDNQYEIYFGDQFLSVPNFVGGDGNWPSTENYSVTGVDPTDFLYVATAADNSTAQGFIGSFTNLSTSTTFVTSDDVGNPWEVFPAGQYLVQLNAIDPSIPATNWPSNLQPTATQLQTAVAYATNNGLWVKPSSAPNYSNGDNPQPWQTRPGIPANAEWIWHDSGNDPGGGTYPPPFNVFDHDEFLVFRVPGAQCNFESDNILCDLDEDGELTGDFVITGTFTNLQEIPGIHLLMLPFANSPPGVELCFGNGNNYWTFDDPLDNGESFEIGEDLSNEGAIIVKNAMPGDEVCFNLTLVGENGVECCTLEVCLIMPPCDCLQIDRRLDEFANIECDGGSNISFDYTFQLTNLFGQDVYHAFLVPLGTETIDPHYFDLNAINNGPVGNGQSVTLTTRITTTNQQPGDKVTFDVIIHNEDLSECCLREHCVTIPDCMSPSMPGPVGDVNGDGVVDFLDVQPFVDLLNSGDYHVKADINGDGVVDFADIDPFIAILSGP